MAKWAVSGEPARDTTHLIVPGPARHKRRAVLGLSLRPVVLGRPGIITYFYFYKKSYIHTYNLYLILETPEHDVPLVTLI
jgi:hypothetical protein